MLLVTPSAAAEFLKLSKSTLAKMRISGKGPKFRRHGRSVVYEQSELESWSSQFIRIRTSGENIGQEYRVSAHVLAGERNRPAPWKDDAATIAAKQAHIDRMAAYYKKPSHPQHS